MRKVLFAVIFAGLLATTLDASTIGIWSTGVCSGLNNAVGGCTPGSLLAIGANDNNYRFTSRIDSGTTGNNSSATENPIGSGVGSYVPANSGSEWIGAVGAGLAGTTGPGANRPLGAYTVQTTFDLTNFVASSLLLSLNIADDNSVQVFINSTDVTSLFGFTCATTSALAHDPPPYCFETF